jgi:hypothetical protein
MKSGFPFLLFIFCLQLLSFWTLSIVLFLVKVHNVSKTGFCLRLQVQPTQLGPIDRASPYLRTPAGSESESESESEFLYDWRFTTNQFVLVTSPLRLTTSNFFFQLNTCGYGPYVTSSLRRRWVCHLQLLLGLASAFILRSESHGTHDHILLSQIRDFPNLEGQVANKWPVLCIIL